MILYLEATTFVIDRQKAFLYSDEESEMIVGEYQNKFYVLGLGKPDKSMAKILVNDILKLDWTEDQLKKIRLKKNSIRKTISK